MVEHLKRYTTLGMATEQGKTSNLAGLAIMAELTGKTIAETGSPCSPALRAGGDRRARRTPSRAGFPSRAPRADPSMVERPGAVFVNRASGGARNIIPSGASTIG